MTSRGLEIRRFQKDSVESVELPVILREIKDGDLFHWAILCLEASGNLGEGKSILEFEDQIQNYENGFLITWKDLNILAGKFYQIIDMILIGCKNKKLLRRYPTGREMCQTCDIVIEMFDGSFWEIFSNDEQWINALSSKFKDVKFLDVKSKTDYM